MNIFKLNSYTQNLKSNINFKEFIGFADYEPVETPYEKAMNSLEREVYHKMDIIHLNYPITCEAKKAELNILIDWAEKEISVLRKKFLEPPRPISWLKI